jgi:hypothetical protein
LLNISGDLECSAVSLGEWSSVLRRIIGREDQGNAILRNVGNYRPCATASHPVRLKTELVILPSLEFGADRDVSGNVY